MTFFRNIAYFLCLIILCSCSNSPEPKIGRAPLPTSNINKPTPPTNNPVVIGTCKVEKGRVGRPYSIAGVRYVPKAEPNYTETGTASYYGRAHHGNQTANGEIFDINGMTAAHKTLPLPSCVQVTNLSNNKSVILRVNDRGPFVKGRIIDVSKKAAEILGFIGDGLTKVHVKILN